MKEMTLEELQSEGLRLLDYLDKWCTERGVDYYIVGGALLGAVREGALIPWDDDVDVVLPRPCYERLLEEMRDNDDFMLIPPGNDSPWHFAKLVSRRTCFVEPRLRMPREMGCFIDVFPLDGLPKDGLNGIRKRIKNLCRWYGVLYALDYDQVVNQKKLTHKIMRPISRLVGEWPRLWLEKMIQSNCQSESFDESDSVGNVFGSYSSERETYDKNWFCGSRRVQLNGRNYRAPLFAEEVLFHVYGPDWRTPKKYPNVGHGKGWWR